MSWYSRALAPDDLESKRGLPSQRFHVGDHVRTLIGEVDGSVVKTLFLSSIKRFAWHWKRETWIYKLALEGQQGNRWYLECQLQPWRIQNDLGQR